jgi:phosphatidylinositol alpha-mannosyltransferase
MAPLAPDASATLRTIRALNDEQFDVLHIHEPFAPGPTMTAMLLHPAPVVATFHAAGESASYKYLNAPIKAAAKNIAHRVAVSKDARELVERYVPGDYEILFNGVELDSYRQAGRTQTAGPTIFFCGRHEERKGLDVLLAAMGGLGPEVRLWVASNGPDTDRLRRQYSGDHRIEWLGRISEVEKRERLKGATVFCAPSLRGESFGVVLIEAMAASTAVVASSLDGYRNVATHERDAVLVEPGSVEQLTDALRRVIADEALRERLVVAGEHRADDFSMSTLAQLYLDRYRRVIAAAPPPSEWPRVSTLRRRVRRMMA